MRPVLILSLALAFLPLGSVFAQVVARQQPISPQPPATAASLPGATVAGAPVASPFGQAVPQAGVSINLQDEAFSHQESALQKQVEILKLQVQVAELNKKIADAGSPTPVTVPASVIATPPRSMDPQASTDASNPTPTTTTVTHVSVPTEHKRSHAVVEDSSLMLLGLVKVGNSGQATIADRGLPQRVSEGTSLPSGWQVEAIEDTCVLLRRGRAHRRICLDKNGG